MSTYESFMDRLRTNAGIEHADELDGKLHDFIDNLSDEKAVDLLFCNAIYLDPSDKDLFTICWYDYRDDMAAVQAFGWRPLIACAIDAEGFAEGEHEELERIADERELTADERKRAAVISKDLLRESVYQEGFVTVDPCYWPNYEG